jgi:uncharacterized phage infection (PIP) family protein YhgE
MDFREYAAKGTSELVLRLTNASAASAEEAAARVRDEAEKAADALRAKLTAAADEKTAVTAALKDAQAQADRLRSELKTAIERIEAASRQLDEARKTAEKLEATRTEVSAARDEQARARIVAETELRKARESVEALRADLASAMKTLEKAAAERLASEEAAAAATSQSQAADVKLAAVTDLFKKSAARVKTLEQAQQEHERKVHDLESKLHGARSAPAPPSPAILDELLAGFQALAGASTVSEVLTTFVEQLAAQYPRVALFRVRKGHLQGEHQIGFDLQTDIGKLVLPLGMDSLPSRAASSGQIERLTGKDLKASRTPFSGTPTAAMALPIAVAGEAIAVVYADDSGAAKRDSAPAAEQVHARYTEALLQYTLAVLMRLSNELKALAELRTYAVSLLNEIEQMYNADTEAGLEGADLQKRLAGNLDYARSIYGSRTALEKADAATLVDEELTSLIEARHGTAFAADLAMAAGHPPARSAAEAS